MSIPVWNWSPREPERIGRRWTPGMMSSLSVEWTTPRAIFAFLDAEFHFTLDVCATIHNRKTSLWLGGPGQDALQLPWTGVVWCNPPYGRRLGDWIAKGLREAHSGATVVMLVPARTDTSWWHDLCMRGEIRFLRGRLRFNDDKTGRCPFPSAVVIFRPLLNG